MRESFLDACRELASFQPDTMLYFSRPELIVPGAPHVDAATLDEAHSIFVDAYAQTQIEEDV